MQAARRAAALAAPARALGARAGYATETAHSGGFIGLLGWRPWKPLSGPASDPEKWNEAVVEATDYRTNLRAKAETAIIPRSSPERVYDIKYYTHSQRRSREKVITTFDLTTCGAADKVDEVSDKIPFGAERRSLFLRPKDAQHIYDYTGADKAPGLEH
eukprot:PRCOL_00003291-RA